MPNSPSDAPRRITVQRRGPLLVEGPVEVELEDGTTVSSDRFRVALCTCRRSRRYPWCDTSHRARTTGGDDSGRPSDGASRRSRDSRQ
ncbi:CDGSH iron-sulfur domain-containing protein [Streptomyces sp. S.PNR 29]|uniref:CDGSH iron-sulfur domain-containing protein n=1 Tax=Streptomyces sp. S.PNR 29 TaxID=2973805 RepID=UPI0025B0931C|nr:CDGSH iron-sulfur domain-containing protein [Streptomyces sp. S.PNR 29]MDN0197764.1 CDGSH iron-sulfur domain-containing protein [Streptomyces sp. S.PNR 29]